MSVLATITIASTLIGSINQQTVPSSYREDKNMESGISQEVERSKLISEEGIIDNVFDKFEIDYGKSSFIDSAKKMSQKGVSNLKKYKLIIGDPFDDVRPITIEELRQFPAFKKEVNRYIYSLYPELRNFSKGAEYECLPTTEYSNATLSKEWINFIKIINSRDYSFYEANNVLVDYDKTKPTISRDDYFIDNYENDPAKEKDNSEGFITYSDSYNFSHLDSCLNDYYNDMKMINDIKNGWTVATIIGAFLGFGYIGSIGIGISNTLFLFQKELPTLIATIGNLNEYEEAVLYKYRNNLIYNSSLVAYKMKKEPNEKTERYFGVNSSSIDNNVINAFKHTYWNAWLTYNAGVEAAKYFTDAHEYAEVIRHKENNDSKELRKSNDMDLKNNEAGRRIGTWWKNNSNNILKLASLNSKVPNNDIDCLSYITLFATCRGKDLRNNIYTFLNDEMNENNIDYLNNDKIYGLCNTFLTTNNPHISKHFDEETMNLLGEHLWKN